MVKLRRGSPSWRFPLGEAVELVEEQRPRAVFIRNPNNPTATVLREGEIEDVTEVARKNGTLLVFDELYWGLN